MQIQPIHTEKDYQKALERIEEIFDAKPLAGKAKLVLRFSVVVYIIPL
jgi:antitoxin component HigA of HigAB toxin-antitoxin module